MSDDFYKEIKKLAEVIKKEVANNEHKDNRSQRRREG